MRNARAWIAGLMIGAGLMLIGIAVTQIPIQSVRAAPTATREPLIPTRTPGSASATSERLNPTPTPGNASATSERLNPTPTAITASATRELVVPPPTPVVTLVTAPGKISLLWQGKPRWGIGVANGPITRYDLSGFSFGWFLDWNARRAPAKVDGAEYAQMIRVKKGVLNPSSDVIKVIARQNPGSLWLIGNEPDSKWQDNVEPRVYAAAYRAAYTAIKSVDPTARLAVGGVIEPTPLRMRYLDLVLAEYRQQFGAPMPIDVWNIHNFILREERNSWGAEIPPGLKDAQGVLYEVDDSGNLDAFRRQIKDFRKWMAARGYQNHALIVSEYGIPMPEDYGFPPERVTNFLTGTFDFFFTATDPAIGYPSDDYKLVQRWCWFSLDDTNYPTGRLFDPQTGKMTNTGKRLAEFITQRFAR